MLSALSSYAACLKNSEKVYWDLGQAVAEIDIDFERKFLPEPLSRVEQLDFLGPQEKLRLNQIGGHAYAHLFYFVEEFIIAEVHEMARHYLYGDRTALRALYRFCEEEVKHQKLFEAFKERFAAEFPVACGTIGDADKVAKQVVASLPLAVMLLVSMLEWITQKHYLSCFRDGGREIDESFARLFHLHWLEEAQHAKLDSLEIDRMARGMDKASLDAAVSEFLSLCKAVNNLLEAQCGMIVEDFSRLLDRELTDAQRESIYANQLSALRWTFIGCGLEHPVFLRIISDLAPQRHDEVAGLAPIYS